MNIRTFLSIAAIPALLIAGPALGGPPDHVNTPADIIHPNIHQNVGGGNNANPNGVSPTGGANLHGIGNTPGQSDTNPNTDGVAGFANQLTNVHGGIDSKNKNAVIPLTSRLVRCIHGALRIRLGSLTGDFSGGRYRTVPALVPASGMSGSGVAAWHVSVEAVGNRAEIMP